jgi:hypothetical protein
MTTCSHLALVLQRLCNVSHSCLDGFLKNRKSMATNAFHTPAAARRKLTFAFDSEFRELALLGLLQFLFALSGIGIGQIGLVRILRLAIDMKVPDDDGNPMDIGVVLPVSTI